MYSHCVEADNLLLAISIVAVCQHNYRILMSIKHNFYRLSHISDYKKFRGYFNFHSRGFEIFGLEHETKLKFSMNSYIIYI